MAAVPPDSLIVVRAERLFTGVEEFAPGELVVAGAHIVSVGPPGQRRPDVVVHTLVPGFVDVHNHGGGGAEYTNDPGPAATTHHLHGTTTIVASLVSAPIAKLERQVRALAPLVAAGVLGGLHLEGPWLAPAFRGAHRADALCVPVPGDVDRLLGAADGAIRMVTIAPELPGAIDTIRELTANGVVVALGHTGADYDLTTAAIEAGASGATHLFNAMPPLHHRSPGPVLALLADDRVWLEVIADGVHADPRVPAWLLQTQPERTVLITDAMAAACCGDGAFVLGDLAVEVHDGVARVAGTDTIAGSTITLERAVHNCVHTGIHWHDAVRAATVLPARYLGLADVGMLAPGWWADANVLTADFRVDQVLRRGEWITNTGAR